MFSFFTSFCFSFNDTVPHKKVGAVFVIVKFGLPFSSKAVPAPLWLRFARSAYSTVLKASWQAYPLLYGHLIFKVQRVRCITPFHRFFFDLFTCLKKYPSICTNRERVKYRVFWKTFFNLPQISRFSPKSCFSFCIIWQSNAPSKGRKEKARFTTPF